MNVPLNCRVPVAGVPGTATIVTEKLPDTPLVDTLSTVMLPDPPAVLGIQRGAETELAQVEQRISERPHAKQAGAFAWAVKREIAEAGMILRVSGSRAWQG